MITRNKAVCPLNLGEVKKLMVIIMMISIALMIVLLLFSILVFTWRTVGARQEKPPTKDEWKIGL